VSAYWFAMPEKTRNVGLNMRLDCFRDQEVLEEIRCHVGMIAIVSMLNGLWWP